MSGFVEEVLVTLDCAQGQLIPFAWLGTSSDAPSSAPIPKKPRKASKKTVHEDVSIETEVVPETFIHPPPTLAHPAAIILMDQVPALDITTYAPKSSSISPPSKVSSSFDANPLGVPYCLPSGITVTKKTVSRREEPTTSLLLKNCTLQKDMEGIMGYSSPTELQDAFSHFHLKEFSSFSFKYLMIFLSLIRGLLTFMQSTECAHGLFLKWKESEKSRATSETEKTSLENFLSDVIRERDEARAQAEVLKNKHEHLQAVCDGLVKSKSDLSYKHEVEVGILKSSLEESKQRSQDLKAQLASSQQLLAALEKQLEQLSTRPSPEVVIKREEESDDGDSDGAHSDDGLGEDEEDA
ncbi:hypothetical protein LIER_30671 [Lithospermum erythrorhizon]|uniref:Uncharacterized protein n=1 Tax=Lithospermum erythrorhizon TaxID=34254 RepID=A0AAV3RNF7_LITER